MNKSLWIELDALRDAVRSMDMRNPPDVYWWLREIDGLLSSQPPADGVSVPRELLINLRNLSDALDPSGDDARIGSIIEQADAILADESSERREAPAEDRIDWAAYPWAMYAAKDENGDVWLYASRPRIVCDKWHRPSIITTMQSAKTSTIPGPWQDSLMARPADL